MDISPYHAYLGQSPAFMLFLTILLVDEAKERIIFKGYSKEKSWNLNFLNYQQ